MDRNGRPEMWSGTSDQAINETRPKEAGQESRGHDGTIVSLTPYLIRPVVGVLVIRKTRRDSCLS
jgi:hypothetical protein